MKVAKGVDVQYVDVLFRRAEGRKSKKIERNPWVRMVSFLSQTGMRKT